MIEFNPLWIQAKISCALTTVQVDLTATFWKSRGQHSIADWMPLRRVHIPEHCWISPRIIWLLSFRKRFVIDCSNITWLITMRPLWTHYVQAKATHLKFASDYDSVSFYEAIHVLPKNIELQVIIKWFIIILWQWVNSNIKGSSCTLVAERSWVCTHMFHIFDGWLLFLGPSWTRITLVGGLHLDNLPRGATPSYPP